MSQICCTIGSSNEPNSPPYSAHPGAPSWIIPLNLATRHLTYHKKMLIGLPGGGRSTCYQINPTYEQQPHSFAPIPHVC